MTTFDKKNYNQKPFKKHFFTDEEIAEKVRSNEYYYNTILVINESKGAKRTVLNFAARHNCLETLAALAAQGMSHDQIMETYPHFTAIKNGQVEAFEAIHQIAGEMNEDLDKEVCVRDGRVEIIYPNMLMFFADMIPKVVGQIRTDYIKAFTALVFYGANFSMKNSRGMDVADMMYMSRTKQGTYDLFLEFDLFFSTGTAAVDALATSPAAIRDYFEEVCETERIKSVEDKYGYYHYFC
jgi:hypothetical protein